MKTIIAIDPGTFQSGYVIWDGANVLDFGKIDNEILLNLLPTVSADALVIEQIRSYGNAMGQSTIDTVFWSGRFAEAFPGPFHLLPRVEVKKHLCHTGAAKDTNVKQALVDRFAYGVRNHGKGIKSDPGFFYGFVGDVYSALGVAVCFYDREISKQI